MKARVKLIEGVSFVGQSESGHSVVMDGAPESGGKNLGVRP
ncbi:MAG TPA: peroxiredoxin, partial [Thiobacillus sp.]|nr:peroxiredoxin [Thiobacillus sp.]